MITPAILSTKEYKTEDQFTGDVYSYTYNNYPFLRKRFFHIPNESIGNAAYRIQRAAKGVLPGVPDFHFKKAFKPHEFNKAVKILVHPWWLELKIPGGSLTKSQKDLFPLWQEDGEELYICWTGEEVVNILRRKYGVPLYHNK